MCLSDMYFDTADELLSSGNNDEAGFFTSVGAEVRRLCELAFGELPQRDYVRGIYVVKHGDPKEINSKAVELAEKVLVDTSQADDIDELKKIIHERVKKYFTDRDLRPLAKLLAEKIKTDDYIKITAANVISLVMDKIGELS